MVCAWTVRQRQRQSTRQRDAGRAGLRLPQAVGRVGCSAHGRRTARAQCDEFECGRQHCTLAQQQCHGQAGTRAALDDKRRRGAGEVCGAVLLKPPCARGETQAAARVIGRSAAPGTSRSRRSAALFSSSSTPLLVCAPLAHPTQPHALPCLALPCLACERLPPPATRSKVSRTAQLQTSFAARIRTRIS